MTYRVPAQQVRQVTGLEATPDGSPSIAHRPEEISEVAQRLIPGGMQVAAHDRHPVSTGGQVGYLGTHPGHLRMDRLGLRVLGRIDAYRQPQALQSKDLVQDKRL